MRAQTGLRLVATCEGYKDDEEEKSYNPAQRCRLSYTNILRSRLRFTNTLAALYELIGAGAFECFNNGEVHWATQQPYPLNEVQYDKAWAIF